MFLRSVLITFIFCFFLGCAKETAQIKEKKEFNTGLGYIELNCQNYYFYGDVWVNHRENFFEVNIYNFGNEILKVEGFNDKIKIFYLGNEIKGDYYELFPVNIKLLFDILKRYFFQEPIEESESLFFEIDNGRKILNIIINDCKIRIFLIRNI